MLKSLIMICMIGLISGVIYTVTIADNGTALDSLTLAQGNLDVNQNSLDRLIRGNVEDTEKALSIVEAMFNNKQKEYIHFISTKNFRQSKNYKTFIEYLENGTSINVNYRTEIFKKEFIINENEKHLLIVVFKKDRKDNLWYIEDAYLKIKGKIKALDKLGFPPQSSLNNFQDLIVKYEQYLGVAKYGKLNTTFFQKNRLNLSKNGESITQDIILYRDGRIQDVVYLTFKYFPVGYKEKVKKYEIQKSGWLLTNAGSMAELYPRGKIFYIDYLLNRLGGKNLDLKRKSDISSTNLKDAFKNKWK